MNINEFCNQYKTHPVLFVGTGISMRYYRNSSSWEELLKGIVVDYESVAINERCCLSENRMERNMFTKV